MHLHRLELEEFRLYRHLSLDLPASGVRAVGHNASGKSTLMEAIALLATMRSPRSSSDRELINWQSGIDYSVSPYARAVGNLLCLAGETQIEIGLQTDGGVEGPLKKSVKVDGRSVRALDAVGELKVVLFAPEDVALVSGSPSGRRRYLDLFISQIDRRYVRSLSRFNRIVEQRNSLLKSLAREGRQVSAGSVMTQMAFWNEELIVYGSYILARRLMICAALTELVRSRFNEFSEGGDLALSYRANVDVEIPGNAGVDVVVSLVHRVFESRLEEIRVDELRRGVSLIGPHRDDFELLLNNVAVGTYGSRGQQRLAVVALKLAEADLMANEAGEHPVILLDDVLSELDGTHRDRLLSAVSAAGAQLILTSTDQHLLEHDLLTALPLAIVTPGLIEVVG